MGKGPPQPGIPQEVIHEEAVHAANPQLHGVPHHASLPSAFAAVGLNGLPGPGKEVIPGSVQVFPGGGGKVGHELLAGDPAPVPMDPASGRAGPGHPDKAALLGIQSLQLDRPVYPKSRRTHAFRASR